MCLCFEHPQVIDMPEHNPGQMGGTMRLGKRRTLFQTKNSVMSKSCHSRPRLQRAMPWTCLGCCWGSEDVLVFLLLPSSFFHLPDLGRAVRAKEQCGC